MIIKNTTAFKQKYSIISFSNPECMLKENVLMIPSTKKNEEKPVSKGIIPFTCDKIAQFYTYRHRNECI